MSGVDEFTEEVLRSKASVRKLPGHDTFCYNGIGVRKFGSFNVRSGEALVIAPSLAKVWLRKQRLADRLSKNTSNGLRVGDKG